MIKVLVVDDSAYVRKTLGAILGRSAHLRVVGYAGDGQEALEQVARLNPDVVTVDLEMPVMNGVRFIEEQMRIAPLPIVVVSAVDPDGRLAGASMRAGAMEFVLKPTHLADQRLAQIEEDLLAKVHAVADIPKLQLRGVATSTASLPPSPVPRAAAAIVIGVSTGGPQLLHQVLPRLAVNFPLPLAVVIHMPVGFTRALAERLDGACAIEVMEARHGLDMRPGRCIIGRAGQNFRLHPGGSREVLCVLSTPSTDELYRPSVDHLFESASKVYGADLLGLVLTGMGHDGRDGSAWVKANGGRVYTQARESCVVWGMPRAVQEAGLSDGDLSPDQIPPFLSLLAAPTR